MKDVELEARLRGIGMPAARARELTRRVRDELHPVAVVSARQLQAVNASRAGVAHRKVPGVATLGALPISTTASLASTGAKIGAAAGPIGAGIGAAIGAVASLLINTGHKSERKLESGQYLAELRKLPPPSGNVGRLISLDDYQWLFWALFLNTGWMDYAGSSFKNHPSTMTDWAHAFEDLVDKLTRAAVSTPVGAQATITHPWGSYTFTNPGLSAETVDTFSYNIVLDAWRNMVNAWGLGKRWLVPGHGLAYSTADQAADARHVFALLTDFMLAKNQPPSPSQQVAQQQVVNVPPPVIAQATQLTASNAAAGNVTPTLSTPPMVTVSVKEVLQAGGQPTANPATPVAPTNTLVTPGMQAATPPSSVASSNNLNPTQDATAGLLQQLLSQQLGANLVSPPAQQIIADVAREGVTQTPAGPPALPSWVMPAALAAGASVLILLLTRKR